MSTTPSTRLATPADVEAILGLVRQSLGEGSIPRSLEYWHWKHNANPFGASPTLLAESDGEIIGLRTFMRWCWLSGGSPVPAVRAVDTATHPAWRGKGIFSRLTFALVEQMKAEGVAFVFNTPNAQSRPGYLKMGWKSLGRTNLWIRPCRTLRLARSFLRRGGRQSVPDEPSEATQEHGFRSVAELLSDPAFDGLPAGPSIRDQRLRTAASREYLAWRYVAVPGFRYYADWTIDGDTHAALIFRFKQQGALRELRVCDMIVGPGGQSRAAASQLLRAIVRQGDADYGSAMAAGTTECATLLAAAFLPAPATGPIFTVRPLTPGASPVDPTLLANWRPSIGALELF